MDGTGKQMSFVICFITRIALVDPGFIHGSIVLSQHSISAFTISSSAITMYTIAVELK